MRMRKETMVRLSGVVAALVTVAITGRIAGQQPENAVRQTAFSAPVSGSTPQQVHFSRRAPRIGDEADQKLGLELRLTMTMRQGNQIVGKNQTALRSTQRRVITTTEVDNGRITAVRVRYPLATKEESAVDATATPTPPTQKTQPVQGKTYICRRDAGENGELIVTDEAGNRPPTDEYEIVAQQMQMVGRQNPLAQFLAGRTISVGQKIELPNDIARQLFNLAERFGKITQFALTLRDVESNGSSTRAVFDASVVATSNSATQMRLEIGGPFVVDAATCRAQRIGLTGPIAMSQICGSYSAAYQMIGTGRLQMSIASDYRDATR
ncbi:MAG TPA: hypothetical protein VHE81_19525 [Lacipirellulaceae bacterium]|nr:hypothetical protein [Lacipirellulaceae bacterium]